MVSEAAGWYARLDQACPDRAKQIRCWLDFWESSVISGTPIAASLPNTWPTLPAGLLTDPGVVLEKLFVAWFVFVIFYFVECTGLLLCRSRCL